MGNSNYSISFQVFMFFVFSIVQVHWYFKKTIMVELFSLVMNLMPTVNLHLQDTNKHVQFFTYL